MDTVASVSCKGCRFATELLQENHKYKSMTFKIEAADKKGHTIIGKFITDITYINRTDPAKKFVDFLE